MNFATSKNHSNPVPIPQDIAEKLINNGLCVEQTTTVKYTIEVRMLPHKGVWRTHSSSDCLEDILTMWRENIQLQTIPDSAKRMFKTTTVAQVKKEPIFDE